jgi:hypothetical protein
VEGEEPHCKSEEEIEDFFINEQFSIVFVNTQFDFTNFDNPIETYIDDSLYMEIDPGETKNTNFYITTNGVQLEDDYFQLGQSKEFEFYGVENIVT